MKKLKKLKHIIQDQLVQTRAEKFFDEERVNLLEEILELISDIEKED